MATNSAKKKAALELMENAAKEKVEKSLVPLGISGVVLGRQHGMEFHSH